MIWTGGFTRLIAGKVMTGRDTTAALPLWGARRLATAIAESATTTEARMDMAWISSALGPADPAPVSHRRTRRRILRGRLEPTAGGADPLSDGHAVQAAAKIRRLFE